MMDVKATHLALLGRDGTLAFHRTMAQSLDIWRTTMPKLTGGQALAKSLYREGVRVIFGLVGAQLYYATDALYDEPGI
ncbi:uncharacterized protein METZ01_LOCUS379934, partial [marine metagenome]